MKITNQNYNKKSITYALPENTLTFNQAKKVDAPSFETPMYQFWFQDEGLAEALKESEFCGSSDTIHWIRFNVEYGTDITATLSYEPDFQLWRDEEPYISIEEACEFYLEACNVKYEVELTPEEKSMFLDLITKTEKKEIMLQIQDVSSQLDDLISPWEDAEGFVYSLNDEERKAYTMITESLSRMKNELVTMR